jgi:hypothetical protein
MNYAKTDYKDDIELWWMKSILRIAGIYNVFFGIWCILFPTSFFRLSGMELPNYPELWQCIGMIVGVYGIGYWIAASAPLRHWPIVLVGLVGKILGPLGFIGALISGRWTLSSVWLIVTNDLVWWLPFGAILWGVTLRNMDPEFLGLLSKSSRDEGKRQWQALINKSSHNPILVVFLRHLGCIFCAEAVSELRDILPSLNSSGISLTVVSMSDEKSIKEYLGQAFSDKSTMSDIEIVSDPTTALYREVQLPRGSFWQLFGWSSAVRGFSAMKKGFLPGRLSGDGAQLAGVFLLSNGAVVASHLTSYAGETLQLKTFLHDSLH